MKALIAHGAGSGLALDRVGFTVEDRDRTQGLYFVRYVDQGQDAENKAAPKKASFPGCSRSDRVTTKLKPRNVIGSR